MKFLVLEESGVGSSHETDFRYLEPKHDGDTTHCPLCGRHVGMIRTLPPYHIEVKGFGKALGDVAFGPGNEIIVSERLHQAWESANLRGLEFLPIDRIRARPARLGRTKLVYFHVRPERFGTEIDMSRSHILRREPISCEKCKYGGGIDGIRGFSIDESSWTGEDMFFAWGLSGSIIVTDRVRQLRDEHGLTNMHIIPVEEYYWDPYGRPPEQTAHLWDDPS